jgi:bifunctional DNA-binding transcriptional regulator/antitoxin component of YhaV-PrlF toxin-antitoxin module
MTTTLSSRGQVAIPDQFRELDHLQPGDDFEMHRTAPGRYVLEKVPRSDAHATRCRSPYGHDVLVAPAGAPPLTPEVVKELLDEA